MRRLSMVSVFTCVCAAVLAAWSLPPATACDRPVALVEHSDEELLDRQFGPLPKYDSVVTGVDMERLAKQLLGQDAVLMSKRVKTNGVGHRYIVRATGAPENEWPVFYFTVGVFQNQEAPNSALIREVRRTSLLPPPRKGFGDRAFCGRTRCMVIINNVFLDISWRRWAKEQVDQVLNSIVNEVQAGDTFVTRGKRVIPPKILSVGLPERVRTGKRVTGNIVLSGIDPAKALVGTSEREHWFWDVGVRPGSPPTVILDPPSDPKETGRVTFTICVATPTNVLATKEVSILIEP